MLTAVVLHPPRFGATVASVDDQAALAEAGVTAVVPIDEGVAVVAETVADAQRGLRALVVEWDDANAERRSSERAARRAPPAASNLATSAVTRRDDGDVDEALADAAPTVDATYTLPYLAHAPMEPNNAACRMREDGVLEVWVGDRGAGVREDECLVDRRDRQGAGGGARAPSPADRSACTPAPSATRRPKRCRSRGRSTGSTRSRCSRSARRNSRSVATARWPSTGVRAGADADGRLTAWHQQIVAAADVGEPAVRP